MQKLRVLILDEFVDNVLGKLQAESNIHMVNIEKALPRWENLPQPYTAEQEIRRWQRILSRVNGILNELGLKKELGLFEQLFMPRERELIETSLTDEKMLLNNAEEVVATIEKEIEENIEKFEDVREFLWEMRTAKIDVEDLRSTETLYVKLGKIPNEETLPLENELKSRIRYVSVFLDGKKRTRFIALISLGRFSEEIEKILDKYGFQEVLIPKDLSGDPSSCLRLLDSKSSGILKKYEEKSLCFHDAVLAQIERLRSKENLGKTERIFVLEAWAPEEKIKAVTTLIEEASGGFATVLVSPPDAPEPEIPTLLKDRKIIGSFRMLTEMYGVPLYNEIDPTPFLAVFFASFVGLMSADIALGTTVIVSSFLIRRGAGSRSRNMKDLSLILLCIGISTVFFGMLMGEFFGGLVKLPVLWMSAADNPLEFLFIVIWIGIGHVIIGSMLGILNNFYKRQFRNMVGDQLSTLLLIGTGAFFLSTGRFELQGINIAAYVTGIVGLVMLLVGKGLTGLLELTRLLSNVISYVRILALNMATAWMSRTFVLLGGLVLSVYLIGPVLDGILLLFSHFFIVFISVFATFAHALRLHYVEFFGRFFIGGGTKFSPLTSERMYTQLGSRQKETESKEAVT
ncbi:MAG: V-type ATP synthase subunit I [Candidatus Bathyarchaeia archaeon]